MKKLLFMAAACAVALGANAQEVTEQVVTETYSEPALALKPDFRSNWFITAGAGAQMFFGDHDREARFGDRLGLALDGGIGKWFSPSIGVRLMWSGLQAKGAVQTWGDGNGIHGTDKEIPGKHSHDYGYLHEQKFDYFTLHADVLFDLCNMIGGYRSTRVYSVAPYIGVGWGHVTSTPHRNALAGHAGILNIFRVSKAFDINLDIRGTIFDENFDGEAGRRHFDGVLGVTAGLTYRFAPRGWKVSTVKMTEKVAVYNNDAVNDLRGQVADLIAQNEKLEKEKAGQAVKHNTVSYASGSYLIYFPINVSSLSNADRAQLEMVADMIKNSDSAAKFSVVGYADKATGSAKVNETLSRDRAQAVCNYLVDQFGIDRNRLEVSWQGGVANMFLNDPALSRVVIVKAQ